MKTSLIIPVYNEEKRIYDCLDQLLQFSSGDYEIIVSADGCTDRTIETAKSFQLRWQHFTKG